MIDLSNIECVRNLILKKNGCSFQTLYRSRLHGRHFSQIRTHN